MPHMSAEDITNWILQQYIQQQEEDYINSYEYLTELCETIGNHYVGIENIDQVTEVFINDNIDTIDNNCPICLDNMREASYCRKINACSHVFCGPCIEQWFEQHKTCPICKKDVTEHQISSISTSCEEESTSEAAATPSSSDPLSMNMT